MSGFTEPKYDATHNNGLEHGHNEKHTTGAEVFENKDLMTDAENAENREHEMTLWQAVKDHPAACFWAFIFCFTIVSLCRCYPRPCKLTTR
jgi:SP family general alpha glucoside:H+ symporter-like MFS transporter